MSVGMGLMASRLGFFLLVVGQVIFYRRLIGREEGELAASQGDSYRRFCAAVPRLVPALTPRIPASGTEPAWGQAWLGEAFFWIFAVSEAAFAWTLQLRIFGWCMAGGFAIYYLSVAIQRPAAKRG
jgi:protein-S-isoprenylcysteine O-methyltransferase Ste14